MKISPRTRFLAATGAREWTGEQSRAGVKDLDEVPHR
jgi:hypothetical protein